MEKVLVKFDNSNEILNEINAYLEADFSILEQFAGTVLNLDETGAWICKNAILLKNTLSEAVRTTTADYENLKANINNISNNLSAYDQVNNVLLAETEE